ncbi:hypothetical protein ACFE04_031486 [Oxalis oulophora]
MFDDEFWVYGAHVATEREKKRMLLARAVVRERKMTCAPPPTDGFDVEVGGDLVVSEGRWSWTMMEGLERSQLGESVESDTVGEVQPVVKEAVETVPDVSDRGEDVIAGGCEVEAIVDELAHASRLNEDEQSRQDEVLQSSENEGLIGSVENEVSKPPFEVELQVQPVVDVEKEETKEIVDKPLDLAFAKDVVLNGVVEEKL